MPVNDQGINNRRYMVIPRVLLFIFCGQEVLLLRGSQDKKIWPGHYNGIGGHVEKGEDAYEAAIRELKEESGLSGIELFLCGTVFNDCKKNQGILLLVYKGEYCEGNITCSDEGTLEWIKINELTGLQLVEDLPVLIAITHAHKPGHSPFSGRSYYDLHGKLTIKINQCV